MHAIVLILLLDIVTPCSFRNLYVYDFATHSFCLMFLLLLLLFQIGIFSPSFFFLQVWVQLFKFEFFKPNLEG
jgi:hypothetical protein